MKVYGQNKVGMWTVLLSVLLHVLILWSRKTEHEPYHFSDLGPIEVVDMPQSKRPLDAAKKTLKKEPEIAETEDAKNRELDPNAVFLSDRNQTAQKQMKADQTDDFRAKQGTGLKNSLSKTPTLPSTGTPEARPQTGDMGESAESAKKTAGVKRNWKTLSLKDLGIGGDGGPLAATDDRLEGVDRGDKTVLSTREFRYYSYYHRIKETLRQYWKPNVERKLAVLWSRGAKMKETEVVTQVLVTLNRSGSVAQISRVVSSGFSDLDEAAMEAFREAAPFPNPPSGMVDPDGLVRIRWDFILKTEASPQITFRGARRGPGNR